MDCTVHGIAKSRARLSNFHFTSLMQKQTSLAEMMSPDELLKRVQLNLLKKKKKPPPQKEYFRTCFYNTLPFSVIFSHSGVSHAGL